MCDPSSASGIRLRAALLLVGGSHPFVVGTPLGGHPRPEAGRVLVDDGRAHIGPR
ncbi:MAG: hypothetical protein KTR25_10055 [Myxococcales bacterium]|nr:hypothetical protein [Myxococcales bacterium]